MQWRQMAARLAALVLVAVAACSYPTTQMQPVVRQGERFDAALTDAVERGDFAEAHRVCERWLELARRSGTTINMVAAYETIAWVRWAEGDVAAALAASDAMGDWAVRAIAGEQRRAALNHFFSVRAWLLAEAGSADEAAAAHAELARQATQPGDRPWLAIMRAWLAVQRGDLASANAALAEVDVATDDDSLDLLVFARARPAQADEFRRRLVAAPRSYLRGAVLHRWPQKEKAAHF